MKNEKIPEKFMTAEKFSLEVEKYRNEYDGYLDAVLAILEREDIDILDAKPLLTPPLIQKINKEAMDRRLLEKVEELPFE